MSEIIVPFRYQDPGFVRIAAGKLPWGHAHVQMFVFTPFATPAYAWFGRDFATPALAKAESQNIGTTGNLDSGGNVIQPPSFDLSAGGGVASPRVHYDVGTAFIYVTAGGNVEGSFVFTECRCAAEREYQARTLALMERLAAKL